MKHALRSLGFAIATMVVLLWGHNPASASFDSYAGIAVPLPETQISLTDDSQLACHALAPAETTAEFF
jgi:hypothetical protein